MAESSSFISHFLIEFIGSIYLGIFQNMVRRTPTWFYVFPFLTFAVYSTAYRITGAHLNPIISLISMARSDQPERYNRAWMIGYIFAQIFGFLLGCFICWWFFEEPGELFIGKKAMVDDGWWYSEAIGTETFAALAFALIYLNQTSHITWAHVDPGMQCFLISVSYAALVAFTSYRTGGSLNPAYAFGQCLTDQFHDLDETAFKFIWIYVIFPIIGAFAALGIHELVAIPGHKATNDFGGVMAKAA
jgi:glycerol uptake facilitator-like aquaporin